MKDKVLQFLKNYKQWSEKHPVRNVFIIGFGIGFILGAIIF